MGKKRIKKFDLSKEEDKKTKTKKRELVKSGKQHGRISDMGAVALEEAEQIKKKKEKTAKEIEKDIKPKAKKELKDKKETKKKKKQKQRSKRYQDLKQKIDLNKYYSLKEAVNLLLSISNSNIDETVEIHISTRVDKLTGKVKLPHGTGKTKKVVIATPSLIDKISNGKIEFDILIASPQMMPKIAKVAKILGPKGLMPNPKTGTISDKPNELKKKLEQGEIRFRTEAKAPLLHLTIGKISFGNEKLLENLQALIKAVQLKNVNKAVLTSTHSPAIKLELTKV